MVVMTAKVSKSKLIALFAIIAAVVAIVAAIVTGGKNADSAEDAAAPVHVRSNDERVAYLSSYGWTVNADPAKTQHVRIPTEPSEVFDRYNALQLSQGFDLCTYSGKTVTQYVYEILNYADTDAPVYATLLVYQDTVIGADIASSADGGIMHGLKNET